MARLREGHFDRIAIHHSAVSPGAKNKGELLARAATYNQAHSKRSWAETIKTKGEFGFPYIEYHYMIAKDGTLIQTQAEIYVLYTSGDNAKGKDSFNLHGISILLDGNYQNEKPTEAQKQTLAKFIVDFRKRHPGNFYLKGHKETSLTATACPGKNIGTSTDGWLKSVLDLSNDLIQKDYEVRIRKNGVVIVRTFDDDKAKAQTYFDEQTKLLSEIITNVDMYEDNVLIASHAYKPQTEPQEPPPPVTDPIIQVKESEWKAKNQQIVNDSKLIQSQKEMISDLKKTIGGETGNEGLNGAIMKLQTDKDKAISDAQNIARSIKTVYDFEQTWQEQHWRFEEAVQKLTIKDMTAQQLFSAWINKLFTKEGKDE